ncbi:hypothetical protein J132_10773 [Termitomyces sp. J132]|nr:hypothetical protein C0989_006330 [Termitomyces sp. Mn162]KAH0580906.1 hypothetical protein H2248_012059 [Termitomyces sp. 'cryptogamus']KNZ78668.1 hypothetical protein J132_10773 [Termitomyces sp. J132]
MENDSLEAGPGPAMIASKFCALEPCCSSIPASTPGLHIALTAHSIIIHTPDCKGKGKSSKEEEEMAVDLADIPLPANCKDNTKNKLQDYLAKEMEGEGAGENPSTAE